MRKTITVGKLGVREAESIVSLNTYHNQRRLDKKYVKVLAKRMNNGSFCDARVAIGHIVGDVKGYGGEKTIILDSQHTAHAVLETGTTLDCVYTDYYFGPGDSDSDICKVFTSFNAGKAGSTADVVAIFASQAGMTVPKVILSACSTALAWLFNDCSKARDLDKNDQAELVVDNREVVEWVSDLFLSGHRDNRKHIKLAGVVAAMIAHWRDNPSEALDFWTKVRDGAGLTVGEPAYTLRHFLMERMAGVGVVSKRMQVSGDEMHRTLYSKSIHAINAARAGRKTKLKYHPNSAVPRISPHQTWIG